MVVPVDDESARGSLLFARYAHAPNELGYCGPEDRDALLRMRSAPTSQVEAFARGFEAAWPYLSLLGRLAGTGPMGARAQSAYWLGDDLLDEVDPDAFERWLEERPALRATAPWDIVRREVRAGARPYHGFHVFALYPWFWLLRSGHEGRPLEVLDRCRIRWGTVVDRDDLTVRVRLRPLTWDGRRLALGPETHERATLVPESGPDPLEVRAGDLVSLHWDQVCDRLTDEQVDRLERRTIQQLELSNDTG